MTDEPRLVYDGFHHWSARVTETKNILGARRWRAEVDRKFGYRGWGDAWLSENEGFRHGSMRRTEAQAEADATRMLDDLDLSKRETRGRYV